MSTVGEAAVKSLGFARGSGSAGAVGAEGGASAKEGWGAGTVGVAAGAWANASEAVSGNSRAAVKTELRFFNEFLLLRDVHAGFG